MILVTVGGQMPFDRLIRAVDSWASGNQQIYCYAQIGKGGWRPKNMEWVELLPPKVLAEKINKASLVIAHAGMGTILSCLELGKKLIVVPRYSYLRETRNDHQVATAQRLAALGLLVYAADEERIVHHLDNYEKIAPRKSTSCFASPELINSIIEFIKSDK
ncbi:glycosyltransferase [Desulfopila inferna]|uniref:glycosyltransferase n=1 Tax=Desulfopila inferna TaxID=468528 RepID=UPI0019639C2C|nr:glucuronosyltransferase [Desulfopila inferna]